MPIFYRLDSPEVDGAGREPTYSCIRPGEVPPVFDDYSGKANFLTLVCSPFDDQGVVVHFSSNHFGILKEAVNRRFSDREDLPGAPEMQIVGPKIERVQFEPEPFGSPADLAIKHVATNMN